MKPSGTTSLVAGVYGPGLHFSKMVSGYRLVRVANNSELIPILKRANYQVESSATDPLYTSVVYFPWLPPKEIRTEEDATIWEKFKMAADMQWYWADNQVSCTVEFTSQEAERGEISRCLEAFEGQIKGISLLPRVDGVYKQMPFTRASREEVEAYSAKLQPLDFSSLLVEGENADSSKFCEACML